MEVLMISREEFTALLEEMRELKSIVLAERQPQEQLLDNTEFVRLLNISTRTAQIWRDEGKVAFSQIGKKIYYRFSDIMHLMDRFKKEPFGLKS